VKEFKNHVTTDLEFRQTFNAEALEEIDRALKVSGAALWIVNKAIARKRKAKRKVAATFLLLLLSTDFLASATAAAASLRNMPADQSTLAYDPAQDN
jgi:hypothetical protein